MTNVVRLMPMLPADRLRQVALEINEVIEHAGSLRLEMAIRLAEAKKLCEEADINFSDWVRENVDYDYQAAWKLAKIGAAPDPAKALEDLRAKERDRKRAARIVGRPTTPITVYGDLDDPDEEENISKKQFLARAQEAIDFAFVDNIDGVDGEQLEMARKVVQSWSDLVSRMEQI